jgi:hypothetical protein
MEDTPCLALVDGDILVYRLGFASEDQEWPICRSRVDHFLSDLLLCANVDGYKGWLTHGKDNYRNEIAVTLPYKGNRPAVKPKHYHDIRGYLVESHGFVMETTQEADDALGIEQCFLETQAPNHSIICSIDKDLLMIPGWHYNFVTDERRYVTKEEGMRNFYIQLLTGDRTDNIPGIKGIGPVKAKKLLDSTNGSEEDMYLAVLDAYTQANGGYQDAALKDVLERGRLLWIRREKDQLWTPPI